MPTIPKKDCSTKSRAEKTKPPSSRGSKGGEEGHLKRKKKKRKTSGEGEPLKPQIGGARAEKPT